MLLRDPNDNTAACRLPNNASASRGSGHKDERLCFDRARLEISETMSRENQIALSSFCAEDTVDTRCL